MKKDNYKTNVRFYVETLRGGILAVFPDMPKERNGYRNDLLSCYSHVGQHSTCAPEYLEALHVRQASESEYKDLKEELESIGYRLVVLNQN